MAETSLLSAIRKRWGTLVLAGLLAGSLAFFGLVFFSKSFKATTDFLVVQNASETQDFYSMLKSSEYLGKVLSESVYSEKFIGAVIETGGVNENFIPSGGKDRLEAWSKIVSVKSNPDAGILHVTVYGNNDRDTLRISQAISKVLVERNALFRSGDEKSVEIRVLSGPIVEKNPDTRTLPLVFLSGLVFGVLSCFSWVFVKESNALNALEEKRIAVLSAEGHLIEAQKNNAQESSQNVYSPEKDTPQRGFGADRITFNDW